MIKFIHKKHINKHPRTAKVVIYYSLSEILLGLLLVALSIFFIYNYLDFKLFQTDKINYVTAPTTINKNK